jgi:hypothetical protein
MPKHNENVLACLDENMAIFLRHELTSYEDWGMRYENNQNACRRLNSINKKCFFAIKKSQISLNPPSAGISRESCFFYFYLIGQFSAATNDSSVIGKCRIEIAVYILTSLNTDIIVMTLKAGTCKAVYLFHFQS